MIAYEVEANLSAEEFIDCLRRSGLDARRPVDDPDRIAQMLAHSNLIVGARKSGRLIGVSRAVTDFGYCCYLSDLAVDRDWQRQGVGRRLIDETRRAAGGETISLILLAAPGVEPYYRHIGMESLANAFMLRRER